MSVGIRLFVINKLRTVLLFLRGVFLLILFYLGSCCWTLMEWGQNSPFKLFACIAFLKRMQCSYLVEAEDRVIVSAKREESKMKESERWKKKKKRRKRVDIISLWEKERGKKVKQKKEKHKAEKWKKIKMGKKKQKNKINKKKNELKGMEAK